MDVRCQELISMWNPEKQKLNKEWLNIFRKQNWIDIHLSFDYLKIEILVNKYDITNKNNKTNNYFCSYIYIYLGSYK